MADGSTVSPTELDNNDSDRHSSYLKFVCEQINYHNTASKRSKIIYQSLFAVQSIVSFGITLTGIFIAKGVPDDSYLTYIVGGAGVLLSAIATLHSAGQYNSRWLHHRNICQILESELRVYRADSGEYQKFIDQSEKFHLFVKNIEQVVNKEHQSWKVIVKEGEKNDPKK